MAQTIGLVQRLKITNPPILAWVYVGPSPSDTEFLFIPQPPNPVPEDAAYRGSIVDALSAALVAQHEVKATHADDGAEITALEILAT